MKNILIALLVLITTNAAAQNDNNLLNYFRAHKCGACILPYNDSDKGKLDSNFKFKSRCVVFTEDTIEHILVEARKKGEGKAYDIAYINRQLGYHFDTNSKLVRVRLALKSQDTIALKELSVVNYGETGKNSLNGKKYTGLLEGYVDSIDGKWLDNIPYYFLDNHKFQILEPLTAPPAKSAHAHKHHSVGSGWILVLIPLLLFLILLYIVSEFLKGLNMTDVLSEITNDKVIIKNPEYSLEKLIEWSAKLNSGGLETLAAKFIAVSNKVAETSTSLQKATEALEAKKAANPAAKPADLETETQAVDKAKAELNKLTNEKNEAQKAIQESNNPATLANLIQLFPATIEISNTADNGSRKGPQYRQSASRLIAFISTVLMIIVGLSMTCFYIYYYLRTDKTPDMTGLTTLLIALGLGMSPYLVNKLAGAINQNKDTNK